MPLVNYALSLRVPCYLSAKVANPDRNFSKKETCKFRVLVSTNQECVENHHLKNQGGNKHARPFKKTW